MKLINCRKGDDEEVEKKKMDEVVLVLRWRVPVGRIMAWAGLADFRLIPLI
jgi:hypothetical protein